MIYGYVRVSTDKQSTENQRFEVENYSKAKGFPYRTLGRLKQSAEQQVYRIANLADY